MKLTLQAHNTVRQHIPEGGIAIDATAGNGLDTSFLARCVGAAGQVFAFDIQQRAIAATQYRLQQANLDDIVTLVRASHDSMSDVLPSTVHRRVNAIMFNLGYLPGGDKSITTNLSSTLRALSVAMTLLSDNGVLSIMAYRGHAGGITEFAGVSTWVQAQASDYAVLEHQESPNGGPSWWLLSR